MNREEWLQSLRKRGWSDSDISKARFAWNAGNRAGKEEAAEICERLSIDLDRQRNTADVCKQAIMETIE